MIRVCSIKAVRELPDGPAKTAMLENANLCHGEDADLQSQMEEDLNIALGGAWYLFEEGDDFRNFPLGESNFIDLLSEEWRWCDVVTRENGYFMVFWATNNAGGPCLFIEDAQWIPVDVREWLEAQISDANF